MCNQSCRQPSIFCILPPHMLRNVVQNGSPQERDAAVRTMTMDATFRIARAEQTPTSPAARPAVLAAEGEKRRTIYTANHTQSLPGTPVRAEGSAPSGDVAVNEAYDGLGATFDFYWDVFERNSIDDAGLALDATVHFGKAYDNAFWNSEQMIFGDGDGKLFNRFTIALDVIGHELTHGVTQDEAQLRYSGQPGALNESMSDVFGALVKQFVFKQTAAQADWLIGAGLLAKGVNGVALRSIKDPGSAYDDPILGKDPQPKEMRHYVHTYEDNGGVHINSGIANRAFYLAAVAIGGNAWEKTGRIWYETLRDPKLRTNSGFRTFARLAATNAGQLYGQNSSEQQAVRAAWAEVGIALPVPAKHEQAA